MKPEYEPGERYRDEAKGIEYEIENVEVRYEVSITHPGPEGETTATERVRYPERSLTRKINQEGLTPATKVQTDSEASDAHECEECGQGFPSEKALNGHKAVHSDGGE